MNIPFRNIRQLLSLQAKVAPDKVFLTTIGAEGEREELTYAEFNARAHQAANLLHTDFGVQAGDVVAIIDDHPGDVAVLLMACWLIGADVFLVDPFNREATPVAVAYELMLSSKAGVCISGDNFIKDWIPQLVQLRSAPQIIKIGGIPDDTYPHFNTLVRNLPNTFLSDQPDFNLDIGGLVIGDRYDQDEIAIITPHDLLGTAQCIALSQGITGNQHLACGVPLYHIDGLSAFLMTLLVGASLTLFRNANPSILWRDVAASHLHVLWLTYEQLQVCTYFAATQFKRGQSIYGEGIYQQDINHLRHIICTDNNLSVGVVRAFVDRLGILVMTGRGKLENFGIYCLMPIDLNWEQYRHRMFDREGLCIGIAIPECVVSILDMQDNRVSSGERGYIYAQRKSSGWTTDYNMDISYVLDIGYVVNDSNDILGRQFIYLIDNPPPVS
jgi:acyl-CoA synthetase (AMP-forming)/AMP-acid ligase II